MASYFKAWNTLIDGPDPDRVTSEYPPTVGRFCSGQPVAQGLEVVTCEWDNITIAHWIDIRDKHNTNKSSSGTFVIPAHASGGSWTSWRSVTAYSEHPQVAYAGRVCRVTWRLVITA